MLPTTVGLPAGGGVGIYTGGRELRQQFEIALCAFLHEELRTETAGTLRVGAAGARSKKKHQVTQRSFLSSLSALGG